MSTFVGAEHEFHSKEFAKGWADRFIPTPERLRLFELIHTKVNQLDSADLCVIELGIGPGYLAEYILERSSELSYVGIDFSEPMLNIARQRLTKYSKQTSFLKADLVSDKWSKTLPQKASAIVSTWALHDLGNSQNVRSVYDQSRDALKDKGVLLNGEFIKPEGTKHTFEGGRFQVSEHLQIL